MNAKNHDHPHSGSQSHTSHKPAGGWKPHRDWRFWTVVLMLAAMGIYVATMEEAIQPAGAPVQPVPADAP